MTRQQAIKECNVPPEIIEEYVDKRGLPLKIVVMEYVLTRADMVIQEYVSGRMYKRFSKNDKS